MDRNYFANEMNKQISFFILTFKAGLFAYLIIY
jgi:hypothetical protein